MNGHESGEEVWELLGTTQLFKETIGLDKPQSLIAYRLPDSSNRVGLVK